MELLSKHLKDIKVPTANSKVYKDECVFSFDNPEIETGLYVSLSTFLGLGRDHVERYFRKTKHAVYLHIERLKHEGDGPDKKITRLAIGVEGGFDPDAGKKKYEFEDIYTIVLLPDFVILSWPNEEMPDIVSNI
ncbi:unnamed protein product [Acanthoscelides obtectus]|uniref:Ubiquitinyl hydrolase variant UBP zinc finger domain-containing protein n=1 Tax=Acanthoscelides obtectus TaxID=200917 RepID=A0A9P0K5Q8_ACAOB|nr:unnamed protein product [Acanthoscelides obtectus]CAK1651706.1 Ubiquitin carboxyl-terminal hydrolase 5 [Acanthoscelides obtectus]